MTAPELGPAPTGSLEPLVPQQPQGRTDWDALMRSKEPSRERPRTDWDAVGERVVDSEHGKLLQSFEFALQHDPKMRAEAQQVADELGIDPDTAGRNLDVMRAHLRKRALVEMDLEASSPGLAKFMRDQRFADIAHKDAEKLNVWERMGKAEERGGLVVELGKIAPLGFGSEMTPEAKMRARQIQARLGELPDTEGPMAGLAEFFGQTKGTIPAAITAGAQAGSVAIVAGQIPPFTALPEEGVTGPAAFGVGFTTEMWRQMAVVEGGNSYFEMVRNGYDEEVARWASRGIGALNATIGTAQLGFLTAPVRSMLAREVANGVAGKLAASGSARATADFLKNYTAAGVSEMGEEVMQQAVEIVGKDVARPAGTPSAFSTKEGRAKIADELAGVATQTLQTMSLLGLPIPVARFIADSRRASQAEQAADGFAALMDAAKDVDMRSFARKDFEAFAKDVTRGGDRENVYVNAMDARMVLAQSAREDADAFRQTVDDETLASAAERGENVVIPTGTYAANIAGTPLDAALRPHAKFDPDAWSLAEAEQFKAAEPELMDSLKREAEKAAKDEEAGAAALDELEARVRKEIEAAAPKKIGKAAARAAAFIVRSAYETMAQRAGVTVDKLPQITFEKAGRVDAAKQQQPGDRGWFDAERLAVALTEKSDPSTLAHELWHAFQGIYLGMAADPKAPPLVRDYADKMMDSLGFTREKWDAMSFEDRRVPNERLAVQFEEYMATGKAPTLELRGAFQQFGHWIRKLYRFVRNVLAASFRKEFGQDLPVIDTHTRRLFDLMLASEDAIAASEAVRGQVATWDNRSEFPGTDEQWSEWKALADAVRDGSIDQLTAAMVRNEAWLGRERTKLEREVAKEAKKLRKDAGAEAAREIASQPLYRLRTWLKQGKHIGEDGKPTGPRDENHKLRTGDVRAVFGEQANAVLDAMRDEHTPDGVPIDTVAAAFGFDSGERMLRELASSPTMADAIEGRADEIMMRDHGDLRDAASQAAAVESALNNEAATRLAAATLRIVARIEQPDRLTMAAVREQSERRLAETPIAQLSPRRFTRNAAKAAREAREAFAGKRASKSKDGTESQAISPDPLRGIAALQRQMLAQEMARQAVDAEKEIAKAAKGFERADRPDAELAKSHDVNMVGAARSVLAAYELGTSPTPARQHLERVREYDPVLYDTMAPVVETAVAQAKPWRDLTLSEFRDVAATVDAIMHQSRRAKEVWFEGKREDREVAIAKVVAGMAKFGKSTGKTLGNLSSLAAGLRHAESWAVEVDGGTQGDVWRYLFAHVREPFNAYQEERSAVVQRFLREAAKLKDLGGPAIEAKELIDADTGKAHTFKSRRELIGAIMHAGNASNARKDWVGRGWAVDEKEGPINEGPFWRFFDRMIAEGKITKADMDFVQATWDLYESLLPRAQEANRANYGYYFDRVEARAIKTPWGSYRGGYVPAKADMDHPLYVAPVGNEGGFETARETQASHPTTGRGFTISRNDGTRALSHDLRLHQRSLDEELRFIHLQRPGRDVASLLMDPRVRGAMQQIDKNALGRMFLPWLGDTMQNRVIAPGGDPTVTKFLTILRRNTALAFMFGNVANAAQQVTGLASSALYAEPKYLRASSAQFLRGGVGARNNSKSAMMRLRTQEQIGQLVDDIDVVLDSSWLADASAWSRKHAYFLQRWVQNPVDHITWDAAYNQGIANGLGEREAIMAADSAVRLSQSSGTAADLSKFERGSALQRMFFQFSSFWITQWNTITQRHGAERWKAAGVTMAFVGVLSGAIAQALRGGWDDEDEDGAMWDDVTQWAFGEAFHVGASTGVPIVGGQIARLLMGESQGRLSPAASMAAIESSFRALRAAAVPFDEKRDLRGQDIQDVAMLATLLLGIPLTLPAKAARYQFDVDQGKVAPTGPADYARGLVTGRASEASR